MTAEQQAIVNFMGGIYGESKKLDESMIGRSSNLQPRSALVEKVVREQLQRPDQVPGLPLTPAEIQQAGVGPGDQPQQPMGDPTPVVEQQVQPQPQLIVEPVQHIPNTGNIEFLEKLDIIIGELRKLNAIIGHEVTDTEG